MQSKVGRLRANVAHIRQTRPDSGLDFQVEVLEHFQVVPSWLGNGRSSAPIRPQASGLHGLATRPARPDLARCAARCWLSLEPISGTSLSIF